MFSKVIKTAKNAGVYEELCSNVMETWIANGYFHGKWIRPGPQTSDGTTKTPFFTVKNQWGTTSRLSLFNCQEDNEVEQRTKGTRFSLVYFPELSNFSSRIVFDATKVQLRMRHLKYEEHQWIGDTNPAEEGEDSWIFKLWFQERYLPHQNEDQKQFREELQSIHFEISDNAKIDPRELADLRASYEYSPDLWNRYIKGHWTASTSNSHFSDVFLPNIHIAGSAFSPDKQEWETIVPDENCHELITGWDPGDVNHSAHIINKRIVNNLPTFDVIDELVFLKTKISIEDFTMLMIEKMDYWQDLIEREYSIGQINWRHWSDDSVFNYSSAANSYDALLIRNASEGRIKLIAANKAKGAVRLRVELMRKLLFQKRMFISAQLVETVRMAKGLKRGSSNVNFVNPLDEMKHIFDSLTYAIMGEAPLDAQNRSRPKVERRSSVVAVGL